MSTWATPSKKPADNGPTLTADIQSLAAEFKLVDGELLMESKPFKAWLKKGNAIPPQSRDVYAEELLTLASKFYEFGGESVARAVAQLFALAADVMGKTIQQSR